ncbi:protein of unknown function [Candidatus Bipolaricaulis anaerobius]|uniref:Uncharacterized protein n=1 Tax=Candidatus Bipolaricaulis anaerobius TaxID=2026885 RepID=A0A2X3K7Y3_9BACT|nr:protein of unknown function [Candidatus Bipolaricaulis anaerobius]
MKHRFALRNTLPALVNVWWSTPA